MSQSDNQPPLPVEGIVIWFNHAKNFGFIQAGGKMDDLFFHKSQYRSANPIKDGDRVQLDIGVDDKGKEIARNVYFLARGEPPSRARLNRAPYFGKPTSTKPDRWQATGGSLVGMVLGSALGPVGALAGAVIGAHSGASRRLEATCLKCGGTGHVTGIDVDYIGFQCEKCRSFWKKRNKEKLTMEDVIRR